MFMMAAGAAMSVLSSVMQSGQKKAQSILAQAQADAANINREGQNALAASQATLANFQRTQANQDRGAAMDTELGKLMTMVGVETDKLQKQGLAVAQETGAKIGAITAASGAAGVQGNSFAIQNQTIKLQAALGQAELDQQQARVAESKDNSITQQGQKRATGMDLNATFAAIDRTKNYAPIQESGKSQMLGAALQGAASGAMAEWSAAGAQTKPGGSVLDQFLGNQVTDMKKVAGWFNF